MWPYHVDPALLFRFSAEAVHDVTQNPFDPPGKAAQECRRISGNSRDTVLLLDNSRSSGNIVLNDGGPITGGK